MTLTARDVVGVPRLPPGWVALCAARARDRLGRLHRAMAPPPVRVLEALFGLLDHGGLVALCELGVPDALDRPIAPSALAQILGVDAALLERVVRYGAARGWVRLDRRGRVAPTPMTLFLRTDHPGGWRAWVDFAAGRDVSAAVATVGEAVRSGGHAYSIANGEPFFEHIRAGAERGRAFDAAMSAGARLHGLALAVAVDWSATGRVCDVGGGDGSLLRVLLDAH